MPAYRIAETATLLIKGIAGVGTGVTGLAWFALHSEAIAAICAIITTFCVVFATIINWYFRWKSSNRVPKE